MADDLRRALTYIEIDIDYCALTYGTSPCTAALGVTGTKRCFNTAKTCQDRPNFTNEPRTLRYAEATEYLPGDIECIPSISAIAYTPQKIDPGVSIGERASVTVTFADHPHSDTDLDKYVALRDYDPFEQGTYWAKFRARNPWIKARPFRLIMGTLGQTLDQMETRHFLIEDMSGPGSSGSFQLIAKDQLKAIDADRAQAPNKSTGTLLSAIDTDDTHFTLDPSGIGDTEYPAAGIGSIGEEMVTFTRAADIVTITRGENTTEATEHSAGDLFQVALVYDAESPADIVSDLMLSYSDIISDWIPLSEWQYEVDSYINRVYSGIIAKPTAVKDLVNELIQQAGLVMWWDDIAILVRMRSLRPVAPTAEIVTDSQIIATTFKSAEQPTKRVSQVWTSYAQINPLEDLERQSNYASGVLSIDLQSEDDNGMPAISKIFSRWIPPFAQSTASRLGAQTLSRYRDPPRKFNFSVDRFQSQISLGRGYRLRSQSLQQDTGEPDTVNMIVTSIEPVFDQFKIEAEEMLFTTQEDLEATKLIVIDQNSTNVNLREAYDSIYAELADDEDVQIIVEAGIIVGSASTSLPGLDTGDWPAGVTLTMQIYGRIQGRGGDGGSYYNGIGGLGSPGGTALKARRAITIDNTSGHIWGGGGGGGAGVTEIDTRAGGGGGAGYIPGALGELVIRGDANGFNAGTAATPEAGGAGFFIDPRHAENSYGGHGGAPGQPGTIGFVNDDFGATTGAAIRAGGAAGKAVEGNANITWTATGDRLGGIT